MKWRLVHWRLVYCSEEETCGHAAWRLVHFIFFVLRSLFFEIVPDCYIMADIACIGTTNPP